MTETIRWLIGVVLAFAGVGIGLRFQGQSLEKPDDSKSIGRKMRRAGNVWIGIAFLYLVVVIVLQALNK